MSKQTREEDKTPNELLDDYVKIYLAADEKQDEFEIRFGEGTSFDLDYGKLLIIGLLVYHIFFQG